MPKRSSIAAPAARVKFTATPETIRRIDSALERATRPAEKRTIRELKKVLERGQLPRVKKAVTKAAGVNYVISFRWPNLRNAYAAIAEQVGFQGRWGTATPADEERALLLARQLTDDTGHTPSRQRLGAELHMSRKTLDGFPRLNAFLRQERLKHPPQKGGQPSRGKESQAIAFVEDYGRRNHATPSGREIAEAVHCSTGQIRPSLWPRLASVLRKLRYQFGPARPGPRTRPRVARGPILKDHLDRYVAETGRIPPHKETARQFGLTVGQVAHCKPFITARQQAASRLGINLRAHPTGKEQAAIQFLRRCLKSNGVPPTIPRVAKEVHVASATPHRWPGFLTEHRNAVEPLPRQLGVSGSAAATAAAQSPAANLLTPTERGSREQREAAPAPGPIGDAPLDVLPPRSETPGSPAIAAAPPLPVKPEWDRHRGTLRYRGNIVRRIAHRRAKNITIVLDAFREADFANEIDDPLPNPRHLDQQERLRETARSLNEGTVGLRFYTRDGVRIGWKADS